MSDRKFMTKPKILLIDDEQSFRENFKFTFEGDIFIRSAPDMAYAYRFLQKEPCDVILLDLALGDNDYEKGIERIEELKSKYPNLPIIVITNEGHPSIVINALQKGAAYFLFKKDIEKKGYEKEWIKVIQEKAKPILLEKQNTSLQNKNQQLEKVNQNLSQKVNQLENTPFIGDTPAITAIKEELLFVAQEEPNITILITGETGVGKEVTARFIHQNGARKNNPFIAVNLTEIPATLLASSLFGSKKGAFTDAKKDTVGLFQQANGGILFLDEIGEIDLEFQKMLLRFLEDHIIRPVGGETNIQLNVQIVAATNKDLPTAVAEGVFRKDLYQRLKVYPIHLPPLRNRRNDIPLILAHYLKTSRKEVSQLFDIATFQQLISYDWPGNIRELRNTIDYMKLRQRIKRKTVMDKTCLPSEILKFETPVIISQSDTNNKREALNHEEHLALTDLKPIEIALAESYLKKGIVAKKLNTNTDNLRYKVIKYYKEYPQLFEQLPNIVKSYKLNK